MTQVIDSFKGKYAAFSNFYVKDFEYKGFVWTCSEGAFQAMKSFDENDWKRMSRMNPSEVKRAGRRLKLREDWEEVKDDVMYDVCLTKFSQDQEAKELLLSTGNAKLIEGNTWGDRYWGVVDGVGKNKLGKTLMKVRETLKNK